MKTCLSESYLIPKGTYQFGANQLKLLSPADSSLWKGYVFISNHKWKLHRLDKACAHISEWNIKEMLWLGRQ